MCGFAPGPMTVRLSLEAAMGFSITDEDVELPRELVR